MTYSQHHYLLFLCSIFAVAVSWSCFKQTHTHRHTCHRLMRNNQKKAESQTLLCSLSHSRCLFGWGIVTMHPKLLCHWWDRVWWYPVLTHQLQHQIWEVCYRAPHASKRWRNMIVVWFQDCNLEMGQACVFSTLEALGVLQRTLWDSMPAPKYTAVNKNQALQY